jgi:hypothetical protein
MARLTGWKEIATHLRTSVRTVQRWERNEALPIHRHYHRKGSTSYATSEELDSWLSSRSLRSRGVKGGVPSIGVMFDVIGQQDALINKLQVVIEGQRSLSRQIAEGRPDSGPKLAGTALKRRPATRAGLQLVPGVGGE